MQLHAWAERLVFGTTLDDKLARLERWTDGPHAAVAVPEAPGRPAELAFHRGATRHPLPSPAHLHRPGVTAQVLHHFANHELLALELMALTLLRFPDSDAEFRRTLVSTIRDEQRHLDLYLKRMSDEGVALGDQPLSAFFWDCLADSPDPTHFIAGMALTLEQANLDFLTWWREGFDAVGDADTVAILDQVHRDEVRHVRHGARWLRSWTPPEIDLYTGWTRRLRPPLTPRRGRGKAFDAQGRRRAGLDEAFIDQVRTAAHSKGRPPRVFWFNPWVESAHGRRSFEPPDVARQIAADLAPTLAILASEDDVVLVGVPPSTAHLAGLGERGWPLPELVTGADPTDLSDRPISAMHPWGRSDETVAGLAGKDRAAAVLATLGATPGLDVEAGRICRDLPAFYEALDRWSTPVIKARWSTAGRGLLRARGPLTQAETGRVKRWLDTQGCVVVEPWRERILDLSLQAEVTDAGLKRITLVRFLTDPRGGFRGVSLGPWQRGQPEAVRRFLTDDGHDPRFVLRQLTHALRTALQTAPDYRGPIGIDALVASIDGELRLRPLVEINPRLTFGRVGDAIGRKLLARGRRGAWLHLSQKDCRNAGFDDFEAWAAALRRDHPPQGAPLTGGVLPITDPTTARRVWTVLVAGEALGAGGFGRQRPD